MSDRQGRRMLEILAYRGESPPRATVRRYYMRWRQQQSPPLPERCDNPACQFHTAPLVWNGKPFKPILDHVDGVNSDNRPEQLRLLCPNCDAQLPTRGGGNKGRVEKSTGGFAHRNQDGSKAYFLPAEPGRLVVTGQPAGLRLKQEPIRKRRMQGSAG